MYGQIHKLLSDFPSKFHYVSSVVKLLNTVNL